MLARNLGMSPNIARTSIVRSVGSKVTLYMSANVRKATRVVVLVK